jgi:hypothetical protein
MAMDFLDDFLMTGSRRNCKAYKDIQEDPELAAEAMQTKRPRLGLLAAT